jgi:hypothetical protein
MHGLASQDVSHISPANTLVCLHADVWCGVQYHVSNNFICVTFVLPYVICELCIMESEVQYNVHT